MAREALMIIGSAWSVATIVLFGAFLMTPEAQRAGYGDGRPLLFLILFAGATTGCGWLLFRRELKKLRKRGSTAF